MRATKNPHLRSRLLQAIGTLKLAVISAWLAQPFEPAIYSGYGTVHHDRYKNTRLHRFLPQYN